MSTRPLLPDYLAAVSERAFAYGALDCCTFMADWLVANGVSDPMEDRRGAYASCDEYEAQMAAEGGILSSCRRRFAAVGLVRVPDPVVGDVCLVRVPVCVGDGKIRPGASGAICVSERLRCVVTSDAGLVIAEIPVVIAWRLARA